MRDAHLIYARAFHTRTAELERFIAGTAAPEEPGPDYAVHRLAVAAADFLALADAELRPLAAEARDAIARVQRRLDALEARP